MMIIEEKPGLTFLVPEITDKERLEEIKIAPLLYDDEKIFFVVKRIPEISVSGTIFVTNKRIIITCQGIKPYSFRYEQLSDVKLTLEPYSHTLVIKTHDSTSNQITMELAKKMTKIHNLIEWENNFGSIRGIPKNKGNTLFKLVQHEIKKAKHRMHLY